MRKTILFILLAGFLLSSMILSSPASASSLTNSGIHFTSRRSSVQALQTTPQPPNPIQTSTPEADGSIVHTVQAGESLYLIAEAYQVNPNEIIRLNNLPQNPVLYPGDRLLIAVAPTSTPTVPATSTPTLTRTPRPTRTPVPVPSKTPTARVTATAIPPSPTPATVIAGMVVAWDKIDPVLVAIGLLGAGGIVLIVVGSLLKRSGR